MRDDAYGVTVITCSNLAIRRFAPRLWAHI